MKKSNITNNSLSPSGIENQYLHLLEMKDVPFGALILEGKDYTITFINQIILNLWGRTKEQAINKPLYETLPELKGQGFEKLLDGVFKTGVPFFGNEVPATLNKSGKRETVYVNFVYNPIRSNDGKVSGIFVTAIDVTPQVIAKQYLKESKTKYKLIAENSQDLIALLSLTGEITYASPSHAKVLGFSQKELLHHNIFDVIHPDDKNSVLTLVKQLVKTKKGKEIEVRLQKKNTAFIWVAANISIIKSEDTNESLLLSARNITDRKKREEEIKNYIQQLSDAKKDVEIEKKRLQQLFMEAPAFITVLRGKDHVFEIANKIYYQLVGYRDIIGKPAMEAIPEAIEQGFIEILDTVFHKGEPFKGNEMKVNLQRKKNAPLEERFVNFVYQPIQDADKTISGIFVHGVDVTDSVRSKQRIEELGKQKDDFLGIASHELKTPVTSIKAYGQVLQTMFRRKGDIHAAEQLGKMDAQINKLTNLIGDLLDVTKIQSGRLQFHQEYFDFNELVKELGEEMQLTTEKHHLIVKLAKPKTIYGDKERIGQVITNLISNAVKYSPHSKKIIISTTSDNNTITLCVQDFGVGIPQDKQNKVFEQFFRVSGPKEITFPGLGLGLYVSSEIIKRQGGKIWVNSIEGKGSTFCFSLPVKKK